jgi:imidazolonepropionase-like amidohydrolase
MVKALLLFLVALSPALKAERLTGFTLVDPASRTERKADLAIEGGKVSAGPGQGAVIDGHGLYLLPAFWDMKASLWGNDSAKDFRVLAQEMGIAQCLRVQLFYGVAHVVAAHMSREWVGREAKRGEALGFPAAELHYPDLPVAGPGGKRWAAEAVSTTAELNAVMDARKAAGVPLVQLSFLDLSDPVFPGIPIALRAEAVAAAKRRGLKAYVFVLDWAEAARAVQAGASVIHGLPAGLPPAALIRTMKAKGCAYAPALNAYFEAQALLSDASARQDPFLAASVSRPVLESFADPAGLWEVWRGVVEEGKRRQADAMRSLKRMADGGVSLLNATDAGWIAACFQGYGTHAGQAWMEAAGLAPWERLRAATSAPAQLLDLQTGFEPGAEAEYIVLRADPLGPAVNLRKLAYLIHRGEKVSLDSLKPDLHRDRFEAR